MIGQLTNNFHADEFKCKDGTPVPMKYKANLIELATNLQALRDHLQATIIITSGYRHEAYNKKIGGASKSSHITAKAADIKVKGYTPKQVKDTIEKLIKLGKMKDGGIGLYSGWVHYDVSVPRRWSKL